MKKTTTIIGALLLVAAIAYPVFAWGPGWGGMRSGMGWGHGPGYCWDGRGGYGYGFLNQEQTTRLDQLRQKFYKDTTSLRNEIWKKSRELNNLLNAANPDRDQVKALQGEINNLRAKISQRRLDFELEARKIAPNTGRAEGYRPGYGQGMMGYGPHMAGFGGGPCWN